MNSEERKLKEHEITMQLLHVLFNARSVAVEAMQNTCVTDKQKQMAFAAASELNVDVLAILHNRFEI